MRRALRWTAAICALLLTGAVALAINVWYFKPVTLDAFYARVFARFVVDQPEALSSLSMLPPWADFYSGRLDDASPEFERASAEHVRNELATLRRFDAAALPPAERRSYDVLEYFLQTQVDGTRFRLQQFPLSQLSGTHTYFPQFMDSVHAVSSERDARRYVARLRAFALKSEQTIAALREREAAGVVLPRFALDQVAAQLAALIAPTPSMHPLRAAFARKLESLPADAMDASTKTRLLSEAETAIAGDVLPAYRALAAFVDTQRARQQSSHGAWSLPDGDAYYAWCVARHTTTTRQPDELHDWGRAEVARIEAEMDAVLRARGLTQGSVGERTLKLAADPAQVYPNTDEGRQTVLARYREIIDEIERGMHVAFDLRPRQGVEVKAVPTYSQDGEAAASYRPGAIDGSRPGIFFVNLRDLRETPKFSMRTVAYHEAIPGHHFQIAIQQELTDVPFFRRVLPFTAYAEGWALYAERLAWELGYQNDPLDNLGRLRDEMLRATRLVVDTGIHRKRWTREQAIDYMVRYTGMSVSEVTTEVERYFVDPGQALAYKVGMGAILDARSRTQAKLGSRFDLKAFHNQVLRHGALPLTLLDRAIDQWAAQQAATEAATEAARPR